MPVFYSWWARDDISRPDYLYRLTFLLSEPYAGGHNKPLTCRVRMPGGASSWFKRDISPGNTDVGISSEERVNSYTSGKILRGPRYCVLAPRRGDMNSGILLCCPR
ncbi:Uncharacterised protein [Serratia proteamaculans]|nr:Uncharacterised protein [Serratia proteamaculans]